MRDMKLINCSKGLQWYFGVIRGTVLSVWDYLDVRELLDVEVLGDQVYAAGWLRCCWWRWFGPAKSAR